MLLPAVFTVLVALRGKLKCAHASQQPSWKAILLLLLLFLSILLLQL